MTSEESGTQVLSLPILLAPQRKEHDMEEYTCHYLVGPVSTARAVYHARTLSEAMGAHNAALPDYNDKVIKWVGPTGITFLMHDSKMGL